MTGKERLVSLGFDPSLILFSSPSGLDYSLFFTVEPSCNPEKDRFCMLQHTGRYGGRVRHVKAWHLKKWTQHY